jgi:hypothetical protein
MIDYPVPLKDGRKLLLKAVNWPRAFSVKGMSPCEGNEKPRPKCLSLLTKGGIPRGTETKYFNTMAFFDKCEELRLAVTKKK